MGSLDMCYGYCSFRYKHKIFLYGGCTEDEKNEYFLPENEIFELNLFTAEWTKHVIKNNNALPNTRVYSLLIPHNNTAYLFCGFDLKDNRIRDFRGLNLNSFEFEVLPKPPVSERDKLEGWTYKDDIYFFGGYGPITYYRKKGNTHFTADPDPGCFTSGWNNELVAYNTRADSWFYPPMKGAAPSGRAAYGLAQFGHRIFIVCGRRMERRCNEIHMLDMREREWSGEIQPSGGGPVPQGRSWMACCPIDHQNIYVQGGIATENSALSDMWLFNIDTYTWSEIIPNHAIPARVACRAHPGLGERSVIVISGRKVDMSWQYQVSVEEYGNNNYMLLQLEPTSLRLLCFQRVWGMVRNCDAESCLCELSRVLPSHMLAEFAQLIN